MANSNLKIGFVGVGNMANAIIRALINVGYIDYSSLYLYDVLSEKLNDFCAQGANKLDDLAEMPQKCDFIVLSVKPQNFPEVLTELKNKHSEHKRTVFVSIAAGIETDSISSVLGEKTPVVRALPNTPMLIGKGVSAICRNEYVSDAEYDIACSLFESASDVIKIDESEMNRIISVTSSSPAYVFKFIKAICDGANRQGLDGDALKKAVCNMVIGASQMLLQSDKSADELISMVCSKGGTTERAVAELDSFKFSDGIVSAMLKCTERANELSELTSSKK